MQEESENIDILGNIKISTKNHLQSKLKFNLQIWREENSSKNFPGMTDAQML